MSGNMRVPTLLGLLKSSKFSEAGSLCLVPWDLQKPEGVFKKPVQQGRRSFGARNVHEVRERERREERQVCEPEGDKGPRTQLAGFFNTTLLGVRDIGNSPTPIRMPARDDDNAGFIHGVTNIIISKFLIP